MPQTPSSKAGAFRDTERFCITDVGSTTTKAILFRRTNGKWSFIRREAPTTVEKPHEDVSLGVLNAIRALEKEARETLIDQSRPAVPYLSTSSAGGGLAMVVTGLVRELTAESADRVALGAGAIVLDVIAMNDGRTPYRKIEDLKRLRPDMVLLAGGFDGDNISGPVYLAELIIESGIHPKLNPDAKLDIIYAGNVNAAEYVAKVLGDDFECHSVPNVRPDGKHENAGPARSLIHDLFRTHVMSQAPGYERLSTWVTSPIRPTPSAFANILSVISRDSDKAIMAIDIGGATTDVYSARGGRVFRTVSANLGLSYSILNVAELGGMAAIRRMHSSGLSDTELWNHIGNKHTNPTSLPRTAEEMATEWAVATVAIREAVLDHLKVMHATVEESPEARLDIDILIRGERRQWEKELQVEGKLEFALEDYDLVIGSGGILSHSPREAAAKMLLDALQPNGVVEFAVDSAFMFPHLGVLAEVNESLARELFHELGIVRLGTVYAPAGHDAATGVVVRGVTSSGRNVEERVEAGSVVAIPLARDEELRLSWAETGRADVARAGSSPAPGESGETGRADAGRPGDSGGDATRPGESEGEVGGEDVFVATGGECGLIVDNRTRPIDAGAEALISGGYVPAAPEIPADRGERMTIGQIKMVRELAIPGDVMVRAGEKVETDTLVARSVRQFLRPFFLRVARELGLEGEEIDEYLVKHVGDEVNLGDVIAKKPRRMLPPKVYRSSVRGRIERVLRNGTLVVREAPELAREYTTVNVAEDLGRPAWEIKPYLRVEKGQAVERGQWLAADIRHGEMKFSTSPVRGKVNRINFDFGMVVIEPLLEELQVRAWLPGKVESVSDRGCTVTAEGISINGTWGIGGEVAGLLTLGDPAPGKVVVRGFADSHTLGSLKDAGAAGLVAAGVDMQDMVGAEPGFTIVVIEGFGQRRMPADIASALEAHEGELALVDGRTQLRVGVVRPKVVLPRTGSRG